MCVRCVTTASKSPTTSTFPRASIGSSRTRRSRSTSPPSLRTTRSSSPRIWRPSIPPSPPWEPPSTSYSSPPPALHRSPSSTPSWSATASRPATRASGESGRVLGDRGAVPALRPVVQLLDRRAQGASLLGQRIGDARPRAVLLDRADDEALGFELAQAQPQDRAGPALADQLYRGVEMRTDLGRRVRAVRR